MARAKVATIVGARPQFIKAASVSKAIASEDVPDLVEVLIHTGQHYDHLMSAAFFEGLALPEPAYHLGVGSGPPGAQIGEMIKRLENVLVAEKPDVVLVYGDTNTTLAGGLAGAMLNLPVAHVEAGLRSFDPGMPEELNRRVTDHVSRWLYCPSQVPIDNLRREGIVEGVELVGDVMYDVFLERLARARKDEGILDRLSVSRRSYAVATIHRSGNTDHETLLKGLLEGLRAVASEGLEVIVPLHPRTRKAIDGYGLPVPEALTIIEPLPYDDMLSLQASAAVILTDSGGMQKEAYWLGIPCVTLREETEWIETVEAGWNRLVGTDPERIAEAAVASPPQARPEIYGDGKAAPRIVAHLATGLAE